MKDKHIEENGIISEDETIVVNIDGKEVECDVLFSFEVDINDKVYVGYTDNAKDEDGNTIIYVGSYKKALGPSHIKPVATEEEYAMVDDVLRKIQE